MNRNQLLTLAELAKMPTRAEMRRMRFHDDAGIPTGDPTILRLVMDSAELNREQRRRFEDDGLAYFRHELDRLDPELVTPLTEITWFENIDPLGVGMGEKSTSFIRQFWGAAGTQSATGKPWISKNTGQLPGVAINGEMLTKPLRPLGMAVTLDEFELASSQLVGRPIEQQKYDAMKEHIDLSTDEMVYIGDTEVGALGLVNQPDTLIATDDVVTGNWAAATPAQIISDLTAALVQADENTKGNAVPRDILLPPKQYAHIHSTQMTNINETIASFFIRTCLSTAKNRTPVSIRSCRWLTGAGVDGTDRMVLYTKKKSWVRFPMMNPKRLNIVTTDIGFRAPYVWIFGEVEIPRPETITYWDDLGPAV